MQNNYGEGSDVNVKNWALSLTLDDAPGAEDPDSSNPDRSLQ